MTYIQINYMYKEAFVTMWKENYQNTRIMNEHMVP